MVGEDGVCFWRLSGLGGGVDLRDVRESAVLGTVVQVDSGCALVIELGQVGHVVGVHGGGTGPVAAWLPKAARYEVVLSFRQMGYPTR